MEAIDAYYRENYNDLVKMCATKVKWEDAEDLVQTAFVLLLEKAQEEEILDIDAFIKTALFSKRIDLHRKQSTEGQKVEVKEIYHLPDEATPESIAISNEEVETFIHAIESQPMPERDYLRLFFLEGIAAKDIADIFQANLRTVYRRITFFRAEFQKNEKSLS